MRKLIISLAILFYLNSFAQTITDNLTQLYPIIGWDSLSSIIQKPNNYPEIPRRAGVTTSISVYLSIDSTGEITKVEPAHKPFNATDSLMNRLFIPSIEHLLKSVRWVPSFINNKPVNDKIYLVFNFNLLDTIDRSFNILAPKYYQGIQSE
jgi:hypothetical protein